MSVSRSKMVSKKAKMLATDRRTFEGELSEVPSFQGERIGFHVGPYRYKMAPDRHRGAGWPFQHGCGRGPFALLRPGTFPPGSQDLWLESPCALPWALPGRRCCPAPLPLCP